MFHYKIHGEYLSDKKWARPLCRLQDVDVVHLLGRSPYTKATGSRTASSLMLNKGFCLAEVREGCAFLIYNIDGVHWLYTAPAQTALEALAKRLEEA